LTLFGSNFNADFEENAMSKVSQILRLKGNTIWFVAPQATVLGALRLMAEKDIGALLVIEDELVVGIFSERDYARRVVLHRKASKDTPVQDVMTERVIYIQPDQDIQECMAVMTDKHIRHLPVMENGELLGVISIGDVVKAIIAEQGFVIEQLVNYITGDR
jgi:signal-transduction protein with cAMP-binding, CBS, and nucleotidyltransferase domain